MTMSKVDIKKTAIKYDKKEICQYQNYPSIISMCKISAPHWSIFEHSDAKLAKSDESKEGAI